MKRTIFVGFKLVVALTCGILILNQAAAAAAKPQAPGARTERSLGARTERSPGAENRPQAYDHYLPLTLNHKQWGYWGHVTDNGVPVEQALLEMRFFNGVDYVTWTTTRTDEYGFYYFPDPPVMVGIQSYTIRWINPGSSDWLAGWWCDDITSANQYSALWQCNFDVMNVPLVRPLAGGTIGIPYWIAWEGRYLPGDSYELHIFDPQDLNPWWWTGGMGWTSELTFWNLPPGGFAYNVYYAWTIWIYNTNGFGIANEQARPIELMPTPQEGAALQAAPSGFSWAEWIERLKMEHPGEPLVGAR